MKDWKNVFIYIPEEMEIKEDDITHATIAPRNMWDLKVQENVFEAIPAKQYVRDCNDAYQRGFVQGRFEEIQKAKGK